MRRLGELEVVVESGSFESAAGASMLLGPAPFVA
jgi:hypothetical protein